MDKTKEINESREVLQKKLAEMQLLNQQAVQINQQIQMLDEQINENQASQKALNEISSAHEGTELVVPINQGIFVKAKIFEPEKLLVNVGMGAVVPRTVSETIEMLEKQSADMKSVQQQLAEQAEKIMIQSQKIEQELSELVKE